MADLRAALPSAVFNPFSEYDVEPVITYKRLSTGGGERHTYTLTADIKNVGTQKVDDFMMHVFFPRAFLPPIGGWGAEDKKSSTETHICFVIATDRAPSGLYPGKQLRNPLTIDYFVDDSLFWNADVMRSKIIVELFSGSMKPKEYEFNIKDFQEF